MAHLYYAENEPTESFRLGASLTVTGDEAHHAVKVSRLGQGERIRVGNGAGVIVSGVVSCVERTSFSLTIDEIHTTPAPVQRVWLVQALAKGDRAERAVEQATELGVFGIIPWQSERSVSRWDRGKENKGRAKWARIAREAAKQSMRPWVPTLLALTHTQQIPDLARKRDAVIAVLDPAAEDRLTEWLSRQAESAEMFLCVGPEGGISEKERQYLEEHGGSLLRLGTEVLRTSSAGAAALAAWNVVTGRW